MARRKSILPAYVHHSQYDRARAVWTDATGVRQFRLLPGAYDSPESRSAYAALLLEIEAAPHQAALSRSTTVGQYTMAELLLAYLDYAENYYRGPDGKWTSEIYEVRIVIRAIRELYADKPVSEFGPLCVKAARQQWINAGLKRVECNKRVQIIKRILKWATSEELAPPSVYQAVAAISGLKKGRTTAPESKPVKPVDDAIVDATLPFVNRHVAGLIQSQRLTGCRPGEACRLRRRDIDMTGTIWFFVPAQHKTSHHDKDRSIAIGPRAQKLLKEFFTPNIDDYLFSPARAMAEVFAERSARRKTPRWKSHMERNATKRKSNPQRKPTERYTSDSYRGAVDSACKMAFPLPKQLQQVGKETAATWWKRLTEQERGEVKKWWREHSWFPNQLRHSVGTAIRMHYGLEAAQVVLGHTNADVTQIYAEKNKRLAGSVISKIG